MKNIWFTSFEKNLIRWVFLFPACIYAAEDAPAGAAGFDPRRGIDANGRIPKVTLPSECTPPERWRYIPEGRIKPGNIFERFLVSSFIAPVVYYQQDVGTGLGLALTDIDFRTQRRYEFAGIFAARTTEGQERYALVWQRWLHHLDLPGGGVAQEERAMLRGMIGYERTITRRFFGLGPDSLAEDESSYTDESAHIGAKIQIPVPQLSEDFIANVGVRADHHNIARGVASGMPSTTESWPDLSTVGDDCDSLWFTTGVRWDTRDSQHQAYKGGALELTADSTPWNRHQAGADRGLDGLDRGVLWTLRGSWTVPVPGIFHDNGDRSEENPPTDTIAIGAFINETTGELPFWSLPDLGGTNTLRGYAPNRFTDQAAWHASAEWRIWIIPRGFRIAGPVRVERVGIAPFYDIGTVASRLSDLRQATIHDSIGCGLRFALERTVSFRADLGFSDEGSNFSFSFGGAF